MLRYDLPEVPANPVKQRAFGGWIDARAVAESWREIEEGVKRVAQAADEMELAYARFRYTQAVAVEGLRRSVSDLEARLRTPAGTGRLYIDFATDMEYDAAFYSLPPAFPDALAGYLVLPEARRTDFLGSASLRVLYQHGGQVEGNDPGALSADLPWRVVVKTAGPVELEPRKELCYLAEGVPCWLEVAFRRPSLLNTITVSPAAPFPVDLVALYVHSPDAEQEAVVAPAGEAALHNSVQLLGPAVFRFPDRYATRLTVLLNQRHARRMESARMQRAWYEYEYGLARLFAGRVEYLPEGQWVSRPVALPEGTATLALRAEEEGRYSGSSLLPHSSVEYEISTDGGRTWIPVLPQGAGAVEHELLHLRPVPGGYATQLRFAAAGGLEVYASGRLLVPPRDYEVRDGRYILFPARPEAPVTASYRPAGDAGRLVPAGATARVRVTLRRHYRAAQGLTPEVKRIEIAISRGRTA